MLQSYKGRELKEGQRVKVYFNLHTHLFSVKDAKTGKVVAHGNNILLTDCEYKVSEAGRQRVLREGRKNVHAYVIGTFAGAKKLNTDKSGDWVQPYYNPHKVSQFMVGEREIYYSEYAWLSDKKVYARL
jgi:hypothetical protein